LGLWLLAFALALAVSLSAAAQEAGSDETALTAQSVEGLSAEERSQLLSRLSDEEARALLLDYLESQSAAAAQGPGVVEELENRAELFRERFAESLKSAAQLLEVPGFMLQRLSEGRTPWHPLILLLLFAVISAGGYLAERLFLRFFAGLRQRLSEAAAGGDDLSLFGCALLLFFIELAGLLIFAGTAVAIFLVFYQGHEASRLFLAELLKALLMLRVAMIASRVIFAPKNGLPSLLGLPEAAGRPLHRHFSTAMGLGAFGFALCGFVYQVGFSEPPHRLLVFLVGIVMVSVFLRGVWVARRPVAESLGALPGAAQSERSLASILAGLWHLPVFAYMLAIYVISVVNGFTGEVSTTAPGIKSLFLLIGLVLADRLLIATMERLLPTASDQGGANDVFKTASHILVAVLGVAGLALIWDAPLFTLESGGIGARLARASLDVVLTVFVGFLVWGLVKAAVARHLPAAGEEAAAGGDEGGASGATRLDTVLPLMMKLAQVTIAAMVVMVALSALGVNIGPLLAGAGVVGLAIGFGAQTLVRDLVSGFFFLLDDAFRKGEYVDVGSAKGTVERINMRSLVLRHHMGPLHTVPFGEIQTLSNYSRDWVIMKLEFRVSYGTDPNKVKKIFKQIGAELADDPELGPDFLEPFKSQGVKSMEDSAMIVRGKFMAKPGKQFTIRKEIYNRVRKAFEENGIEFAHRRVTVDLPEDVKLSPEQQERVAEAAGAAVAAEEEQKREK
jgi:small-conductance mechanosensitive channel